MVGKQLDETIVHTAAEQAADGLELLSDIHGSQEYRRQMAIVFTRRAILHALERARG
ncbi:MAG TPA: hypothetical protein VKX46_05665 [Ktedonobacteraceae bacterium]|nr:hypothetical protein [Ktedonobacteraceae bacterium]